MNPDDSAVLRHARLVLLLHMVAEWDPRGVDAERLGIYDFLAVHPLLLARSDDDPDRHILRLAGFDDRAIAYASPGHRFASAQLCLARDLAALVGQGLVNVAATGRIRYRLTAAGASVAERLTSMYSRSYVTAARIVIRRTRRLSGRRLRKSLRHWLTTPPDRPTGELHPAYLPDSDHGPRAPLSGHPSRRTFLKDLT